MFLTKLFGIVLTALSVSLLLNRKFYRHAVKSYLKDQSFILLSGILALVGGASIVILHPVWAGWEVVLTLVGWIMLIKGVLYLLVPEGMVSLAKKFTKKGTWISLAVIDLAFGLFFLYQGFLV